MQQEQEFDGVVMSRLQTYSLAELEHLFLEFFVELTAVRALLLRLLSSFVCLHYDPYRHVESAVGVWLHAQVPKLNAANILNGHESCKTW